MLVQWRGEHRNAYYPDVAHGVLMKLYAAMVVGIALGAGIAVLLAARELEDAPATTTPAPAQLATEPPTGA